MDVVVWTASCSHARRLRVTQRYSRVAGLEERNPNIFIYRIDLNDLRNLLTLFRGPNPPIFRILAEDNYFGPNLERRCELHPLVPAAAADWHPRFRNPSE